MSDVKCTVSNCYFWAKTNLCSADSILITSDRSVEPHPGMAVGNEADSALIQAIGSTPASSIAETACHTFKAR